MNYRFFWAIFTMSLFLMACSTTTNTNPTQIIGTDEWHLTQLNGTVITTPVVTMQLTDTTIGGQGFCNSYRGPPQSMGTPLHSIILPRPVKCVWKTA
jgi:heat shock protein HslJ